MTCYEMSGIKLEKRTSTSGTDAVHPQNKLCSYFVISLGYVCMSQVEDEFVTAVIPDPPNLNAVCKLFCSLRLITGKYFTQIFKHFIVSEGSSIDDV